MSFPWATTLAQAKSIARHLRLTLRQARSSAYRVNFREMETKPRRSAATGSKMPCAPRLRWLVRVPSRDPEFGERDQ